MYYSATLFNIMGFGKSIEAGLIVSGTNVLFTAIMQVGAGYSLARDLELVGSPPGWAKGLAVGSFAVFVAFYAVALENVPWVANEFLALEVRAVGTAVLTMGALCIGYVSFARKCDFGLGHVRSLRWVCFVGWVFIIFTYPETAGLLLESVRQVFVHGFGVRYANQLQELRWTTTGSTGV
ncbi:hypothetical protein BBP40_012046 [Aspergillus hancockii]|nr:hypothetical protein BBP40_012046 [Aspergillus hancockii]